MFDIGFFEIFIIIIVMILFVDSKQIPDTLRFIGSSIGRLRLAIIKFQNYFENLSNDVLTNDYKQNQKKIISDPKSNNPKEEDCND